MKVEIKKFGELQDIEFETPQKIEAKKQDGKDYHSKWCCVVFIWQRY